MNHRFLLSTYVQVRKNAVLYPVHTVHTVSTVHNARAHFLPYLHFFEEDKV